LFPVREPTGRPRRASCRARVAARTAVNVEDESVARRLGNGWPGESRFQQAFERATQLVRSRLGVEETAVAGNGVIDSVGGGRHLVADVGEDLVDERGERREVFGRKGVVGHATSPFGLRFRGLTPSLRDGLVGWSHHCISVLGGRAG